MTEKFTAVESRAGRTGVGRRSVESLRHYLTAGRAWLTVTRPGAVALALLVAYLAVVVPADLALLLFAVAVAAMLPLAATTGVVLFVK